MRWPWAQVDADAHRPLGERFGVTVRLFLCMALSRAVKPLFSLRSSVLSVECVRSNSSMHGKHSMTCRLGDYLHWVCRASRPSSGSRVASRLAHPTSAPHSVFILLMRSRKPTP